ncbi:hypothetical protein GMDG_08327 [Pseudogymnoascus destructans 20631-21]|uniref:Uncharacterized protein n=1 Tax=Pseudogymnoascus destructans (strain ATCC MYA-4855 / 20631-21) TaxID=658429 RepID=L8G5L4_PSED2|nr:hypothetical protein GMDG_08327 [Pseudogymnoascus destructans 20631-21]
MPQQYTFHNAAQTTMVGWDPAILRNRTPAQRCTVFSQRCTVYLARWGTIAACPPLIRGAVTVTAYAALTRPMVKCMLAPLPNVMAATLGTS